MAKPFLFLVQILILSTTPFFSSATDNLKQDSSLSVDQNNALMSPDTTFVAGFFPVGENAYCFGIWYNEPFCNKNCTIVWIANRDQPVNGKLSKLSLLNSGNLVLTDAGRVTIWSTNTVSESSASLNLEENGNLVLMNFDGVVLWQSFDFPTNTLLPLQLLTKDRQLVSSRSQSNYSSGIFKLYFDNDNVLRLLYDGPDTSSIYWPDPELMSWEAGRSTYNNSRTAIFDSYGNFSSSDDFSFMAADHGIKIQRRLTVDFDGNLRLYSREHVRNKWTVSWQALSQPCRIHGICGPNSLCNYDPGFGTKCSCLKGFKMKNVNDWSLGCEPEFNLSCSPNETSFVRAKHVEFYGYDFHFYPNYTLDMCENLCLQRCDCKGFQLKFIKQDHPSNLPYCFAKTLLLNGHLSPNFEGDLYLKVPKANSFSPEHVQESKLLCSNNVVHVLDRVYTEKHQNGVIKFILWFSWILGGIEFLCILVVWWLMMRRHRNSSLALTSSEGYLQLATGFRKFTYSELKKATRGFSKEIGRGGGGIVYKGVLFDNRIAAIKKLIINDNDLGEAEFRAEVGIFGKLNHMNLIDMWGYCAEKKHRLLVYTYVENGSLAENLTANTLDWKKRFSIALGTAKGLAYLHEECLEWVLHCDVKPQNILLDANYQPKVSDFGLSRPIKRDSQEISRLSKIRGTRGYIAPEWFFNLPITSKVDVYSYGMVLLEIVTGKNPAAVEDKGLVAWVKDEINGNCLGVEKIVDPNLNGNYEISQLESLVWVALKCVEEDKDARPTMKQVVEMLLYNRKHN